MEENKEEQVKNTEEKAIEIKQETAIASQEEQTDQTEKIEISNDVIAVIAGVAVSEVLSGKKNLAKGIKVDKNENKVKIDVNIIVEYGTRIPDVAFEIQNRVKKAVENMTGLGVEEVNVHVQGVDTNVKKEEKVNKQEEANEDKKEQ